MFAIPRKLVPRSIQLKLQFLAGTCVAIAVGLTCLAFISFSVMGLQRSKLQQLKTQAALLSHNCANAVATQDSEQANRLLSSLKEEASIEAAAILRIDGQIIGTYPNREDAGSLIDARTALSDSNHIIRQAVLMDGEVIGELRLYADVSTVSGAITNYVTLAVFIGLGSWFVAFLVQVFCKEVSVHPFCV